MNDEQEKKKGQAEHRTRDIYLAAFCVLKGCTLKIERPIGAERVMFVITGDEGIEVMMREYFSNKAICDPKALKYKITDIKNQMYSLIDNG